VLAIYGLDVDPVKVEEALALAREAVEAGVPVSRAIPKPGEDYAEWTPGEKRAARLIAAYVQKRLRLEEVPLEIALRLEELREDLGLGPWVLEVKTVLQGLREGAEEVSPREAAERVLRGERPAVKGARDLAYLEEVARTLHALKRRREVEERVNRLLTARPDAKVSPEDEAVIFGRLRSGRPVWVRATPEELKALREKAVDKLLRSRPSYLSGAYRYTSRIDLPHPRVRQALRAVWEWVKGEAGEARVLEGEEKRAWPHRAVGEDYELEVLLALGLEADWTDPAEVRALLEPLTRDPSLLPEELDLSGASLAAQEAADADAFTGVAKREGLLRVVRRVHRRCSPGGARKAEAPHRAVARVLGELKLLPQEEVRRLHEEVLAKKKRGLWKAAAQAMPAALEVLLGFPVLYDEMLALAWEWSVRAVEEQRSLKHHPAAMAARLAKLEAPLYAEMRRGAFGLTQESLQALQEVRKVLRKHPGASPEEVARKLRRPVAWVEAVLPLLQGRASLDEPLKSLESEEVYLRDTVEGGETPEEAAEREELRRRVAEALERLEAVHGSFVRQAVERVLMDGTPAELAAEEEGVSLEALEDAVGLGVNFLRGELADLREVAA
jgi:hypothetical protein